MNIFAFALKNLSQRKTRTLLTCLGIAVAVGAVVALVGVSTGFQTSITQLYARKGVDVMVFRKGTSQRIASNINQEWVKVITAKVPGVKLEPVLADLVSFPKEQLPAVQLLGCRSGGMLYKDFTLLRGRIVKDDDTKKVMLGRILAEALGKDIGNSVEIYEEQVEVAGIFESPNLLECNTAVMPLADLQRMLGREGHVTTFIVQVQAASDKATAIHRVVEEINDLTGPNGQKLPLLAMPANEQVSTNFEIQMVHALVWATSVIVLLMGGIGVLNTMMMSVTARTREIGVMRAIGWRRWRVAGLILFEAVLLTVTGTLLGVVAGVGLTWLMTLMPQTRSIIPDVLSAPAILQASGLALLTGLLGGLYPAIMAARLLPSEAIRHD